MEHLTQYQLLDYNSGEIAPSDAAAVAEHLQSCGECRQKMLNLKEELAELISVFPPEPNEIFWVNYLPRLKRRMEEQAYSSFGGMTQWAAGLAAAAVAVMLIVMLNLAPAPGELPAFYEAWTADALYRTLPETANNEILMDIALDEFNYSETVDVLPFSDGDLTEMLLNLSDEEVEKLLTIIKETQII